MQDVPIKAVITADAKHNAQITAQSLKHSILYTSINWPRISFLAYNVIVHFVLNYTILHCI